MQTLLFGHVPVLSQTTGVHAGFLTMKRSVSGVYVYHNATIVQKQMMCVRKLCNCAHAENICVMKTSEFFSDSYMLYIHTTLRAFLWHMFLVCALTLTHMTCININEAHTYLVALQIVQFVTST